MESGTCNNLQLLVALLVSPTKDTIISFEQTIGLGTTIEYTKPQLWSKTILELAVIVKAGGLRYIITKKETSKA